MKAVWNKRAPGVRLGVVGCALAAAAAALPAQGGLDFKGENASEDVRALAQWAFGTRDAKGKPFAVVDKKGAKLFVFHGNGELAGAAAALLGQQPGDLSVPGVGTRVGSGLALHERTTPAGRFDSEPGRNHKGEAIVWFDYDAALAIHRLRPAAPAQRRTERLASATPEDNRLSLGCVVVEPAFYQRVVATTLGRQRGVVYVLPESSEWAPLFGAHAPAQPAMARANPAPAMTTAAAPPALAPVAPPATPPVVAAPVHTPMPAAALPAITAAAAAPTNAAGL